MRKQQSTYKKKMLAKGSRNFKAVFLGLTGVLLSQKSMGEGGTWGRRNQFNRDKNYELSGNGKWWWHECEHFFCIQNLPDELVSQKVATRCFKDLAPTLFKRCSGSVLKTVQA